MERQPGDGMLTPTGRIDRRRRYTHRPGHGALTASNDARVCGLELPDAEAVALVLRAAAARVVGDTRARLRRTLCATASGQNVRE